MSEFIRKWRDHRGRTVMEFTSMFKPPFVRSAHNYDMNEASDASGLKCLDPSLTVQSEAEEADINVLVKRFGITGVMPQNVRVPQYEDYEGIFDFQSAVNAARLSQESFNTMPADIRARFGNDPQAFFNYCTARDLDGKLSNLDEMRKLGLAVAAPVVVESPPQRVVVVEENGDGKVASGSGAGKSSSSSKGS